MSSVCELSLPKISIITVCYNSARAIRRTLESVVSQNYPNLEYIIVDGGSVDGTLAIVDEYRHIVTKVISEPDNGLYDAMNKGIVLATGEWIHLLNSDDYYAAADALASVAIKLDPKRTNYCLMWREFSEGSRDLQSWDYCRWKLFVSAFMPHPAMIVSRKQYEEVGLYDTRYRIAADHDMTLRLTAQWPGLKHDVPLTVMEQGGFSEQNREKSLREFCSVTEKNGLPKWLSVPVLMLKRFWWMVRSGKCC